MSVRAHEAAAPADLHADVARSVAIILDGNARWARREGVPIAEGHRAGTRAVRRTVEAAIDLGVETLTIYAFSTENWTRPDDEVGDIIEIFGETIERETEANTRLDLWIAFDYGGRAELVEAARRLVADGVAPEDVDEEAIASRLYAPDLPDPDLLIRTSGEVRISNFLLWQLAYAELVFVDTFWPDFGEEQLRAALAEYARRKRRFGGR